MGIVILSSERKKRMKIINFIKWGFSDMNFYTVRMLTYCVVGVLGLILHSPYWMIGALFLYWLDFTFDIIKDRWNEFERTQNEAK